MSSYSKRIQTDIARWQADGIIAPEQAERILADVIKRSSRTIGLGSIIGMLAAVLIGAAILLMVASNWEAIPRLTRVLLLIMLIAVGYLGGAFAKVKDRPGRSEALYVIGAIAFGGAIALVGQMYHLAGTETDALITWGAGTGLSAGLLRSRALTATTILIAILWLGMAGLEEPPSWGFPIAMIALWPLTMWTRCREERGLIFLALLAWAALLHFHHGGSLVPLALSVIGAAVFASSVLRPSWSAMVLGSAHAGAVYGLTSVLAASLIFQFSDLPLWGAVIIAALTLAASVASLLLIGRDSKRVRRIAYGGFTIQLLYVYFVLLGSMFGSALFFLASGLVLAGLAYLISRFERRFAEARA